MVLISRHKWYTCTSALWQNGQSGCAQEKIDLDTKHTQISKLPPRAFKPNIIMVPVFTQHITKTNFFGASASIIKKMWHTQA